jgi:peptide/nickel transport system permease protein
MTFLLRRLAFYLAAFVVAASINFALPRLMPGNPIDIMFSQAEGRIPPEVRDRMAEAFGLVDKPLYQEYLTYLASVFTWDLGISIKFYPLPVAEVLGRALPWTVFLVGTAALLAFILGSWLGINAAWQRGRRFDALVSPTALTMQSIPAVVVALTLLFVFGVTLRWLPTSYAFAPALDPGLDFTFLGSAAYHAVMPLTTLILTSFGAYLITMRNNMIGQLGDDHVMMATAKGLSDAQVRYCYAARNALLPSVTAFGLTLGHVLGGSLVTEVVFNYPGLGNLLYLGIIARDYPLIQGQLLIMTLAILTANFLVDLIYVLLDPRLRRA